MNKPLIYVDVDLAISCLMRSLRNAGLYEKAESLTGLIVSDTDSLRHAQKVVAAIPKHDRTESARQGTLDLLSCAMFPVPATKVQIPLDLH